VPELTPAPNPDTAAIRIFKSLPRWAQLIVSVATAGSVLWAALTYLNPIGAVEIVVWIQQEVPIKVPVESTPLPLVLQYKGTAITRATVASATISNSGRTPIGGDKEPEQWVLTIKSKDGAQIVPFVDPEPKPSNLKFTVLPTAAAETLRIQFGLLNPGDSLAMRLLVVNPENVEHPALTAETRIPNLRAPLVTREPLVKRVQNAFIVPLSIVIWIPLAYMLILADAKKDFGTASAAYKITSVVFNVAIAGAFAFVIGSAVSFGLARLLLFQLSR
jgi:hypothetical protein